MRFFNGKEKLLINRGRDAGNLSRSVFELCFRLNEIADQGRLIR